MGEKVAGDPRCLPAPRRIASASMGRDLLLAVPNFSEGRDLAAVEAIAAAAAPARVLDIHMDPDHNRSVLTLAARQGELARRS